MVKFTPDDIHNAMQHQKNIRNLSIIATVDAGKTTITDSLLNKAGILSDDATGNARKTDTRKDEQERGITIKSTGISLYYKMPKEYVDEMKDNDEDNVDKSNNSFLINLIDSPGHVDFSSEVTAALRVTDGCMVILDAIKGVYVQTETVLRQALDELIVPVCTINKIDRLILELQLKPEEFYQKLNHHINVLNMTIRKYNKKMGDIELRPEDGTVSFACGVMGWGFNLKTFAKSWALKLGRE